MEKLQNKTPLVRFSEFNCGWKHKELNELLSEFPAGARLYHLPLLFC